MGAIAMIGMTVTLLTGTLETNQVLAGFGNATVWLVVCAFLLAGAFIRTGLGPGSRICSCRCSDTGRSD